MKDFGDYPVDNYLDSIASSLNACNSVVISAEPGAGKTTRIPIFLKDKIKGSILVLGPRRLAARLSAERCSFFLDQPTGMSVGYQVRHDKKLSSETEVLFITEGLFIRMLQSDPGLSGVGAVILDEFHERNIHTDIALGLITDLQKIERPDLKLVVMSATMDTKLISTFLDNCPIYDILGRIFPVEVEYRDYNNLSYLSDKVVRGVEEMLIDPRCPKNILVFLTGVGEIREITSHLTRKFAGSEIEILPLFADLTPEKQRMAFSGEERKVILSTNVAETSLTLPNITGVIDSGNAKTAGIAPWSGMPTLEVMRVSRASCKQRAGRAGRTAPGVVYRLFSKGDYITRNEFTAPDVETVDLSHMFLDLLSLGKEVDKFPWFGKPNVKNMEAAIGLLSLLGAIDEGGMLTDFGRELSGIPLHPRTSALIAAGREFGIIEDAVLAACMISEGFVSRDRCKDDEYSCDLSYQIDLLKEAIYDKKSYAHHLLDHKRVDRVTRLYQSLAPSVGAPKKISNTKVDSTILSNALFAAFPDRVAVKRKLVGKKNRVVMYNFCMGKGGMIWEGSALSHSFPDYFIAIDAMERLKGNAAKGITVRYGSKVTLDQIKDDPAGLIKTEVKSELNQKRGIMSFFTETSYGKLVIEKKRGAVVSGELSLYEVLKESWPYPFENLDDLDHYHSRIDTIERAGVAHGLPRFEGEMLELFMEELASNVKSLPELVKRSLRYHIESQLGHLELSQLNYLTPLEINTINGKSFRVQYKSGCLPVVESHLHNFYGIDSFPSICEGNITLSLVLTAPNKRAVQVTSNLASFWSGSYSEVSRELSRRYPKHYWPERPEIAAPVPLKRHVIRK